jgi:chromosome segregation ATPase
LSTLGEAAKGAADLVAELEAMEQLLEAEQAERRKLAEQAVQLLAENDQLRVDFAKDMAAIASYRNDIADLRERVQELQREQIRSDAAAIRFAREAEAASAGLRNQSDGLRESLSKLLRVYDVRPTQHDGILGLEWDSRPDTNTAADAWGAAVTQVNRG